MYVVVWRFTTPDPAAFERHYGPEGTWAQLFRRDPSYVRTDLLRGETEYLTLDWWTSREAYDAFRAAHAAEYAAIDERCESLTTSEVRVGEYVVAEGR